MQGLPVKTGSQTVSAKCLKAGHFLQGKMSFLCHCDDCPCERMFTLCLKRIGGFQKFCFTDSFRKDIRHLRGSFRDRSGLVERNDLNLAGIFQRLTGLEEDAVLCAEAVADHDCDRGRKSQCTRTRDDKHGDAPCQRKGEGLSGKQPADRGDHRDRNDKRHKDSADLIRNAGDRRLGGCRIRDHLNDLRQRGIFPDPGCPGTDIAAFVDRCGTDEIAFRLIHRNAFTGQCGFIDACHAFRNDAVHRNAFAGAYRKDIADGNFFDRNRHFLIVSDQHRSLRCQLHQTFQRIGGPTFGHRLQHLSDRDQRQDHCGAFKVEFIMIQRHEIHIGGAACDHDRHPVEYRGTPEKGHTRSECDQGIHIRTAVHQGRKPARKEFLIDHHDDERKDHLRQRQSQVVMFKESRQREVPHVVAHRDVHEHT